MGGLGGIDAGHAIRAVTLDAAYAMFFDDKVGSLEVGKYADLVELGGNPRSTDPAKIPQIKVMATWIEGQPAYTGGKAAEKAGS
ncbi:MAG: amidohydrolase family protein [Chthoniobacterales bacterium]